jgi:hypothetical protein
VATLRRNLLVSLILLIPCRLSFSVELVRDPDLWWHLRTGDWILQHGTVPRVDLFSYLAGHPWVAYSWTFEVLLSFLYKRAGLFGVVLVELILSTAIVAALYVFLTRQQSGFARTAALTALGAVALSASFTLRPWLFTILFLIVELTILYQARNTGETRWLWLLPLLFCVWANTHIQFLYGLVFLFLAAADRGLVSVAKLTGLRAEEVFERLNPRYLWACLAASVGATLINPYHVRIYHVIYEYARHTTVLNYVEELRAMDFRRGFHFLILALLIAGVVAVARRHETRVFDALTLLLAAALAFRMGRDVWILVTVVLGILASGSSDRAGAEPHTPRLGWLLGIPVLLVGIVLTVYLRGVSNVNLTREEAETFPEHAAEFAESHALSGPLYNDFNWGGYLIWRLPEYQVSMDGRTNLHGDRRFARSYATWSGMRDWATDPELSQAKIVIGSVNFPLTSLLRFDPRFRLVYEDRLAVVFVANTSTQTQSTNTAH